MPLKESLQNLFNPKKVREAEQITNMEEAFKQKRRVTTQHLQGKISPQQYNQELAKTYPLTKPGFEKFASEIGRRG